MGTVFGAGIHRGWLSIFKELKDETIRLYEPEWLLADPKGSRAADMKILLKNRFARLDPQPLVMRSQDALTYSRDHDTLVLSLDTLADTTATLQARRPSQTAIFQITGKGPGGVTGTLIAIQGTLTPGDEVTQRSVSLLLPTLSEMSRAASSRELTGPDPVTAAVLQPLRQVVSRQTAAHMAEKGRAPWDLSGSPLSVAFGQTLFPLLAVEAGSQEKYSQQSALALEMAGTLPANALFSRGQSSRMVVVALVQTRSVHFMRVAFNKTGKRSVVGVSAFVPPAPQRSPLSAPAIFTD
jgi:hypothetical protein